MAKKGSKPSYIARAKQTPDDDYMVTIGAAWDFKKGDGFVVQLHQTPTNWDGSFILVTPLDDEQA